MPESDKRLQKMVDDIESSSDFKQLIGVPWTDLLTFSGLANEAPARVKKKFVEDERNRRWNIYKLLDRDNYLRICVTGRKTEDKSFIHQYSKVTIEVRRLPDAETPTLSDDDNSDLANQVKYVYEQDPENRNNYVLDKIGVLRAAKGDDSTAHPAESIPQDDQYYWYSIGRTVDHETSQLECNSRPITPPGFSRPTQPIIELGSLEKGMRTCAIKSQTMDEPLILTVPQIIQERDIYS